MKAVVATAYGSPDVLKLMEVPKPVPRPTEVRIRVHTATVTLGDCEVRSFRIHPLFWLPLRAVTGILKPYRGIFGQEIAGTTDAVGRKVTHFRPGDPVFAPTSIRMGAYAEYICLPEDSIAPFDPHKISFSEAVTIPTGGINGLHFVRMAEVRPGDDVLINGAGGSIGTYALQFAKKFDARVTCVDTAAKCDMLRKLGADAVIDYTKEDFTQQSHCYDVIIDVVGKTPYKDHFRVLKPGGRLMLGNPGVSDMIRSVWKHRHGWKVFVAFAEAHVHDLIFIRDQLESGRISAAIDQFYALERVAEAHRYVEAGLKKGNVIVDCLSPAMSDISIPT